MATQHRDTSPPFLQDKILVLPCAVNQVLLTALAKDPSSRFTNVQTFAEALEQACRSSFYWTPSQIVGVDGTSIKPSDK